ncbi:MAG: 30S ribosomal protein S16 [Phycisphaeraceae bacterium]|nr:MAG: 30S ribosomal protein S16 [Phycisphaeraceae bacterium]
MVRLRFQRLGRHRSPFYRLAAIDGRERRDGPVIENLGWYNPLEKDPAKQMELKEERIKHWISVGAKPSETVEDFLAKRGIGDLKAWEARRTHRSKVIAAKKAAEAAAGEAKAEKKA